MYIISIVESTTSLSAAVCLSIHLSIFFFRPTLFKWSLNGSLLTAGCMRPVEDKSVAKRVLGPESRWHRQRGSQTESERAGDKIRDRGESGWWGDRERERKKCNLATTSASSGLRTCNDKLKRFEIWQELQGLGKKFIPGSRQATRLTVKWDKTKPKCSLA